MDRLAPKNETPHSNSEDGRIRRRLPTGGEGPTPKPQSLEELQTLLDGGHEVPRQDLEELARLLEQDEHNPAAQDDLAQLRRLLQRSQGQPPPPVWDEADTAAPVHSGKKGKPKKETPARAQKSPKKAKKQKQTEPAPPRTGWRRFLPRKKQVILGLLCLFLLGVLGFGFFFVYTTRNDDLWLDLETIPYKTETILYYTDPATGEVGVYATIPCTQNKVYVPGEEIPQYLRDAFVAVEDQKFYSHHGFDFPRTVFAVLNEVWYKISGSYIGGDSGRRQGASTIDQQLIKNMTRDDEDSNMAGYLRKLREVCRAIRMDALYEKDEILDAYMNTISFTGNTAGVGAEAEKLFGKPVSQLTLAECASLAGITRNPARYNPVTNPENHIERRNYVLGEMLAQGYITQAQHDEAVAEPLQLNYQGEPVLPSYTTSYFTDVVIDEVIDQLCSQRGLSRKEASNLFYNGGLRIHTTVNPQLQSSMEQAMLSGQYFPRTSATVQKPATDEEGNPVLDEEGNAVYENARVLPQGAMISLDYAGGIAGVVGGLGEKEVSRGFNRAVSAYRQVGSAIKPIGPYIVALEQGNINWSTPFLDDYVLMVEGENGQEIPWPSNVDNRYSRREILVYNALAQSTNTVAVRVQQLAGNNAVYRFMKNDLSFTHLVEEDKDPGPLALGSTTYGASPLQMASAYAMFGNGGYTVTPHSVTYIENGNGFVMLEVSAPQKRVISEENAYIMNRLLCGVMKNGTGAGYAVPGEMESAGKTGTTNDGRDHWFVGLTPYYVTACWYGYDENLPLGVAQGSHPPTRAWRAVMQNTQQALPYRAFAGASGCEEYSFCTQSGSAAGANCPAATGWYARGKGPRAGCPLHG